MCTHRLDIKSVWYLIIKSISKSHLQIYSPCSDRYISPLYLSQPPPHWSHFTTIQTFSRSETACNYISPFLSVLQHCTGLQESKGHHCGKRKHAQPFCPITGRGGAKDQLKVVHHSNVMKNKLRDWLHDVFTFLRKEQELWRVLAVSFAPSASFDIESYVTGGCCSRDYFWLSWA